MLIVITGLLSGHQLLIILSGIHCMYFSLNKKHPTATKDCDNEKNHLETKQKNSYQIIIFSRPIVQIVVSL